MQDGKKVKKEARYLPPPFLREMILQSYQLAIASTIVPFFSEEKDISAEDWNALSLERKADRVMFQCLMEVEDLDLEKSLQRIAINKKNILRLLSFDKDGEVARYWKGLFYQECQQLSVALAIKKYIYLHPSDSYQTILDYSLPLLEQPIVLVSMDEIRLYHIKEILDTWVDWKRAKLQLRDPLETLRAVLSHYRQVFPRDFFEVPVVIEKFPNIRFLDEAALFWKQLNEGEMFQGIEEKGKLSRYLLEKDYVESLSITIFWQKMIDKLFSVSLTNVSTQEIYFNGLAFKNAKGCYFQDLINYRTLETIDEYKTLTVFQRQLFLKEKFYQIGESTEYSIGSVQHSLLSSLMRIYDYNVKVISKQTNLKALIDSFKLIEAEWEQSKNYPIHPRLLLALHLAESNNVSILGSDWKEKSLQLFNYLSGEFEKILLSPPHFDRSEAAQKILQNHGFSFNEIKRRRYYVIESDNFNLSPTYFGSPLEEFLKRADSAGLWGKWMPYKRKGIDAREALQKAEETFNKELYQDAWVQNKAIENLREQFKSLTSANVEREAKRIALNYKIETENHRAFIRGVNVWLNMVPVVGPLYTIEEGIRDKDPVEIVSGVFFLSLDALDLVSGSEKEPLNLKMQSSSNGLALRERVTLDTVHMSVQKLGLSTSDFHLDEQIRINRDPFAITDNNEVPEADRFLAEQVCAGTQGLKWRNYELIYLADENRVVPIKPQGNFFREINWHTGKIAANKHFIYKEHTGKYYAGGGLKGGNPIQSHLTPAELKERITVKKTLSIMNEVDDFTKYDFNELFNQCFSIEKDPGINAFDVLEFYRSLYAKSPSFRRILNGYHEKFFLENKRTSWTISVEANSVTRTDFSNHRIYITSDAEIPSLHYVGRHSNFEPSKPEQIYLHEILHALTGEVDPIKALGFRHRGPIVYLTDKILSEAGYLFTQRIMYRRLVETVEEVEDDYRWRQHREEATALTVQENDYLDHVIDKAVPQSEYNKVFGEEISSRYTVVELNKLWADFHRVSDELPFPAAIFEQRFLENFQAESDESLHELLNFYFDLYMKSDYFSSIFNLWSFKIKGQDLQPWRFELNEKIAAAELPVGKQVHCINDLTRKIYIFDDKTLYLSSEGLVKMGKERQLVQEMVQLLTGLNDPSSEFAFKNRGAVVQLTDEILKEARINSPKQLAYALTMHDNFAGQADLLTYQIEANRAASLEDRFIRNEFSYHCQPLCRRKRSVENKIPFYLNQYFWNKQERGLEDFSNEIKANLEKEGIIQSIKEANNEDLPFKAGLEAGLFFKNATLTNSSFISFNGSFSIGGR